MTHTPAPDHPLVTAAPSALGRRGFLAAGAGGLTVAALGQTLGAAPAGAAPGVDPTALSFRVQRQQRPLDLVADNFVQLRDDLTGPPAATFDALSPSGRPATLTPGPDGLAFEAADGGAHDTLLRSRTGQQAPYAAVVVDVVEMSGDDTEDRVLAGLVADEGNHVVGWYDAATGTVGVDAVVDGAARTLGTAEATLAAPFRLAFGVTGSTAVVLADSGSGFVPLVRTRVESPDLRRPTELARHRNALGVRSGSGRTVLGGVEAGYFGQLGLRDPHLVTHADGTPYLRDGKAWFTFTNAGLAFFETAHWGVWTLDLQTFDLEQVGNLFFQRDGNDLVVGDHAGHLVLDEDRGRWIVTNSTWGDFAFDSVEINHTTVPSAVDLLSGVHLLRTSRLPLPLDQLPSAAVGQWDPHVVRIRGRWYVGFVNARRFFNFYPALARTAPGADYTRATQLVGADGSKVETEGPVLQKFGDEWYVLASNGDASPPEIRGQYPVYDLRMQQVGILDAPHPTNIPWPMVVPVPVAGGRTRWLLVTFQGTQYYEPVLGYGTHGDVIVMEADQRTRGYPFGGP